jgi:HD-GYP domain-containing protein (c-di-GMP phosphodiesterase class II)
MRMSLEAARQSAEDRATATQTAAAAVATERDSLASRLALTEAEVEKLRAAAAVTTQEFRCVNFCENLKLFA